MSEHDEAAGTRAPGRWRHYHPCYCEENVWHRCGLLPAEVDAACVAVVSNARRAVAMWGQRAAAAFFRKPTGVAMDGLAWRCGCCPR